eukprot:5131406-Lingulodinium_polyedra.AAC.1
MAMLDDEGYAIELIDPALPPRPGQWLQLVATAGLGRGEFVQWYLRDDRTGVTWLVEPRRAFSDNGDTVGPVPASSEGDASADEA